MGAIIRNNMIWLLCNFSGYLMLLWLPFVNNINITTCYHGYPWQMSSALLIRLPLVDVINITSYYHGYPWQMSSALLISLPLVDVINITSVTMVTHGRCHQHYHFKCVNYMDTYLSYDSHLPWLIIVAINILIDDHLYLVSMFRNVNIKVKVIVSSFSFDHISTLNWTYNFAKIFIN